MTPRPTAAASARAGTSAVVARTVPATGAGSPHTTARPDTSCAPAAERLAHGEPRTPRRTGRAARPVHAPRSPRAGRVSTRERCVPSRRRAEGAVGPRDRGVALTHRTREGPAVNEAVHIGRDPRTRPDPGELLGAVALGDEEAFAALHDIVVGPVLGVVRTVLRDPAQSEEVAQEVLVEVWRSAPRYRPERGTAVNWVLTMAHQRAVDRVRSVRAAAGREHRAALLDHAPAYDEVAEEVADRLEREQVRRCLDGLTELQRQAVELAYYRGLTHREVAEALGVPVGTVKTRLRDGLIRLRDCLGVST